MNDTTCAGNRTFCQGWREAGIRVLHYVELAQREREALQQYFQREIFPVLTPLAFDPTHPFPHISSLSFNLAVIGEGPRARRLFRARQSA